MIEDSYYFDPTILDGSDLDLDNENQVTKKEGIHDFVSIDEWKPTVKKEKKITPSAWRQKQIGDDYNQQPGIDELHKIQQYIKKKYPDAEIMNAFGLRAETMKAIREDRYCPVDGIELDNLSKIYIQFQIIKKDISDLHKSTTFILDTLFPKGNKNEAFVKYKNKLKEKKKVVKITRLSDGEKIEPIKHKVKKRKIKNK